MALQVLCLLTVAAAGVFVPSENHFSFFPCRGREAYPLTEQLFVPPGGPTFRERDFAVVPERSFAGWLYVLKKRNVVEARKKRLLWLFNRSWGAQTNGTMMTVVWKDSEDANHPDREVNITGLALLEEWSFFTFRFWEQEAQVAINGKTIFTILGCKPWVTHTGFFLGHTATVANPHPVETQSFFFDLAYYNYIVSDAELHAHMDRGRGMIERMERLDSETASFQVHNTTSPLLSEFPSFPLPETYANGMVDYWKSLNRTIVFPPRQRVQLNSSTFYYYPCLPRMPNVSLTGYRYQPVYDNFLRVEQSKVPAPVAEYTVAFHVFVRDLPSNDWTTLFLVDCSWGLMTNGRALKVHWDSDRFIIMDNVSLGPRWTHITIRLWERQMQVHVDGNFVQTIFASPNVDHCGFVVGAAPSVDRPKAPLRAVFYLLNYFNYIISDLELDAHLASKPSPLGNVDLENVLAGDELVKLKPWDIRLILETLLVGAVGLLLAALLRRKEEPREVVVTCKFCSLCKETLPERAFATLDAAACQKCMRKAETQQSTAATEEDVDERAARKVRKKLEAKRKKEEKERQRLADQQELKRLEKVCGCLEEEVVDLKRLLENAREEALVLKDLLRDEREQRMVFDRDASSWKRHLEESKRKEDQAREALASQLKGLETLMQRQGPMEFLKYVYSYHPPKSGAKLDFDLPEPKCVKLALSHYHPDKQDFDLHGRAWKYVCLEITQLLNAARQNVI